MYNLNGPIRTLALIAVTMIVASALGLSDQEGSLMGRVIDEAGGPIGGALVELVPAQADTKSPAVAIAKADKRGRFKIDQIHPAVYSLRVTAKGFKASMIMVEAVNGRDVITPTITLKFDCSSPAAFCDAVTPSKP